MLLFKKAGEMRNTDPASSEAQDLVKRIQAYITENMYTCSNKILRGLGKMYSGGGHLYPVGNAFLNAVKANTRKYYWDVYCFYFRSEYGRFGGIKSKKWRKIRKQIAVEKLRLELFRVMWFVQVLLRFLFPFLLTRSG